MKKPNPLFRLILLFFALGCTHVQKNDADKQPDTPSIKGEAAILPKSDTIKSTNVKWVDSLLEKYIHSSDNELVRMAVRDKLSEEALFDQLLHTDSTEYFVYGIGHSVADSDGARFITDQWVYLDTVSRALYEYSVSGENLTRWSK